MPFKENDEKTKEWGRMGARKPYTLEQEQLEKMRKILDKDLDIIARIQEQEVISPIDKEKLQISKERVAKYLDKLHVSKTATDITSLGESLTPILVEFVNGKEISNENTDTRGVQKPIQ